MPTIRLLFFDGLLGVVGSNTLFPLVGVVKVSKSTVFAPMDGVAETIPCPGGRGSTAPLIGGRIAFLRWPPACCCW